MEAVKCRFCQSELVPCGVKSRTDPGTAALVSLVLPGAGLILAGEIGGFVAVLLFTLGSVLVVCFVPFFSLFLAAVVWILQVTYVYNRVKFGPTPKAEVKKRYSTQNLPGWLVLAVLFATVAVIAGIAIWSR
ncbi:MAG: hypothetical protein AB7M93_30525 [Candidatus Obscuribacterales bacterium]